jgi:hypothetical protein
MSLVRLLGFRTLACGCVIGRYRELATSRELTYIEEKGVGCEQYGHRRNHTVAADRFTFVAWQGERRYIVAAQLTGRVTLPNSVVMSGSAEQLRKDRDLLESSYLGETALDD